MAGLKYEVDADVQQALANMGRQIAKQDEMISSLRRMNRQGQRNKRTLGEMAGKMKGFIASFIGIGAGIGALRQVEEYSRQIAQNMRETQIGPLKALGTIAGGSQQVSFQQQMLARWGTAVTGLPEAQALDILFAVKSAARADKGPADVRRDIQDAFRAYYVTEDVKGLATAIQGLAAVFGPSVGEFRQILNQAGVAARPATADPAGLLVSMLTAAKTGQIRFTGAPTRIMAETMAMMGVATVGTENPEMARTQIAALLDILGREQRFARLSPLGALQRFAGLSRPEQLEVIGMQRRALTGWGTIAGRLPQISQLARDIEAARLAPAAGDWFAGAVGVEMRDPRVRAVFEQRRAVERRGLAETEGALFEMEQQTARNIVEEMMTRRGTSKPIRAITSAVMGLYDWLGISGEEIIRSQLHTPGTFGLRMAPDAERALERFQHPLDETVQELRRLTEATMKLLRETEEVHWNTDIMTKAAEETALHPERTE